MESSASRSNATAANRTLEIDLYIHVVTSEDKEGTVTDKMVLDQVRRCYNYSATRPTGNVCRGADY